MSELLVPVALLGGLLGHAEHGTDGRPRTSFASSVSDRLAQLGLGRDAGLKRLRDATQRCGVPPLGFVRVTPG